MTDTAPTSDTTPIEETLVFERERWLDGPPHDLRRVGRTKPIAQSAKAPPKLIGS